MSKKEDKKELVVPDDPRDIYGNIIDVANDPDAEQKLEAAYGEKK